MSYSYSVQGTTGYQNSITASDTSGGAVSSTVDSNSKTDNSGNSLKSSSNNFYAGNVNLGGSQVEQRRKQAQKDAMKIISDAFATELGIDQTIQDNYDKVAELNEENGGYRDEISNLEDMTSSVKESYGVTDDSQEQKDLELLEKREDSESDSNIVLTDEEKSRLDEIDENGLTEYQKYAMDNYSMIKNYESKIEVNDRSVVLANEENKAIRFSRLKTHPMVDAEKAAQQVIDSANAEIKGAVVADAKENIDDKMEKEEKEKLEKQEENEEKEEKEEQVQEQREELEALIEQNQEKTEKRENDSDDDSDALLYESMKVDSISSGVSNTTETSDANDYLVEAQKTVNDIQHNMKLLDDDMKGIEVDTQL